jgi:hypothetical protein
MKKPSINKLKMRLPRITSTALLVLAVALTISGLAIETPNKQQTAKRTWTSENAVAAFTEALTRASHDKAFRERLIRSAESARDAVAEVGNLDIPNDKVIMFYEPGPKSTEANDNYLIFALAPLDDKRHFFKDRLMCCYDPYRLNAN